MLAAKAVILNIVSLGAAYGFLVLFWQQGHGSKLVYGVPATGSIRDFIPILVFAFLFGLSMDYEVFLLARMREQYDRTGSTGEPVVGALGHTGRLVTSAVLMLAVSFLSLSTNPDLPVRIIATGLALGILLDAFVVRTLLVPALVDHGPLELVDAQPPRTNDAHPPGRLHPGPGPSMTAGYRTLFVLIMGRGGSRGARVPARRP